LQAKIDQINRRQERNRQAMMDAIKRIEARQAQNGQLFDASETSGMRPIRLSALCAK
jgi:hypothetical protein